MAAKTDNCSFCGRPRNQVNLLFSGISGHICDECVDRAHTILSEEIRKKSTPDLKKLKLRKPLEMKEFLDQYVIGQDVSKKYL
ncbi:MAG: ClpX C4-type zinc finger protein, partial [Bacteroidales bacterium]|nr:ClpX C4-type zinc finger protein [Bacteroidales bacterium]